MAEQPKDANAAAVAGLAREVENLRRRLDEHADLRKTVDDLAPVVARLAETINTRPAEEAEQTAAPVVSWLELAGGDPGKAGLVLASLVDWLDAVYLRYADAILPACWLWHPDVIEELLCLRQTWAAAHHGKHAGPAAVAEWHERQRPGVTARIKHTAGFCSPENHTPDRQQPAATVPRTEAIDVITDWWTTHPDRPPPAPAISPIYGRNRQVSTNS
jgi:hypothetical protein